MPDYIVNSTGGRLLRRKDVLDRLGVSEATLWTMERRGDFPAAVKISTRAVGYDAALVLAWMAQRPDVA
jgi:predicted DNA-binding transcriptional regulator AlpA